MRPGNTLVVSSADEHGVICEILECAACASGSLLVKENFRELRKQAGEDRICTDMISVVILAVGLCV